MQSTQKLNRDNVIKALLNPETYATVLYAILLLEYEDLHEVDSLELYARIKDDFYVEMPEENENKLQAILTVVTTPYFYADVQTFTSICKTLVDGDPGVADFDFDDASVLELLWGTYEVELCEDDRQGLHYAPAIESYILERVQEEALDDEDLEAEEVIPSYETTIVSMILEVKTQLEAVGFKNVTMPEFLME